jgi:hypothetical protein
MSASPLNEPARLICSDRDHANPPPIPIPTALLQFEQLWEAAPITNLIEPRRSPCW